MITLTTQHRGTHSLQKTNQMQSFVEPHSSETLHHTFIEEHRYISKNVQGEIMNLDILGTQTCFSLTFETQEKIQKIISKAEKNADTFCDIYTQEKQNIRSSLWNILDFQNQIQTFNTFQTLQEKTNYVKNLLSETSLFRNYFEDIDEEYQAKARILVDNTSGIHNKVSLLKLFKKQIDQIQDLKDSPYFTEKEKKRLQKSFQSQSPSQNTSFIQYLLKQEDKLESICMQYAEFEPDILGISYNHFCLLNAEKKEYILQKIIPIISDKESFETKWNSYKNNIQTFLKEKDHNKAQILCNKAFFESRKFMKISSFLGIKEEISSQCQEIEKQNKENKKESQEEKRHYSLSQSKEHLKKSLNNDPMSRHFRALMFAAMCAAYKSYGNKHFYKPKNKQSQAVSEASRGKKDWYYHQKGSQHSPLSSDIEANPNRSVQSVEVKDLHSGNTGKSKKVELNAKNWTASKTGEIEHMARNADERENTLVTIFYDGDAVGKDLDWKTLGRKLDHDIGQHMKKHIVKSSHNIPKKHKTMLAQNAEHLWQQEWTSFTSWKVFVQHGCGTTLQHLEDIWTDRLVDKTFGNYSF